MFWRSIAVGVQMLFTHWEIWLSAVVYVIIFLGYLFLFGTALSKSANSDRAQMTGCLTYMITGPAVQGILVSFMVTGLLPILCGSDDFLPFSFLIENWWPIAKAGLLTIIVTIILMFIPVVGEFISRTPGTVIFIQGIIVYKLLIHHVLRDVIKYPNLSVDIFPGFWTSIGFLILSIVFVYIFTLVSIYILLRSKVVDSDTINSLSFITGNLVGVLPGLLSICIYCSYVNLKIAQNITTSLQ